MTHLEPRSFILAVMLIPLMACQLFTLAPQTSQQPVVPSAEVPATTPVAPTLQSSSLPFAATSYQDATAGFEIQYPETWMADAISFGSGVHGSLQLTSWTHEPGQIMQVEPGGTFMNVEVRRWDPIANLSAFMEYQRSVWQLAGTVVESDQQLILASGIPAREVMVSMVDGSQGFIMLSILGENYVVVSGSGDLRIVREIAHTLRPLE